MTNLSHSPTPMSALLALIAAAGWSYLNVVDAAQAQRELEAKVAAALEAERVMKVLPPLEERGPQLITKGGTYRAKWVSDDPKVPAVTVATSEPVTIEGQTQTNGADHIQSSWKGCNLQVRNVTATAVTPNIAGVFAGRFVKVEGFQSLYVHHNDFSGTSGIYGYQWNGKLHPSGRTVLVQHNRARNIDGRRADGLGGYSNDFYRVQFIQLNGVKNLPYGDISWNQIVNDPRACYPEDVVNMHSTTGVANSWLAIHHNLIFGAYAANPAASYSGGGIMLGDGGGRYQIAYDNTVLETSNYGIAIADGSDLAIIRNTVLGTGKLPDGTILDADPDAGIYARDYVPATPDDGRTRIIQENTVGWGRPTLANPTKRNDISISKDAAGNPLAVLGANNILPAGAIDPQLLQQAAAKWAADYAATFN